jgi:hypothetical protein
MSRRRRVVIHNHLPKRTTRDQGGIFYVTYKNDKGEFKRVRVAAASEEDATRRGKSALRGGAWAVEKVERP